MYSRKLPLAAACVAAVICLVACVGVALAATSPTVVTGAASGVGNTSAALAATVTPDGSSTSYSFQYGPTPALGSQSPTVSAGSGTAGVAAHATISGLIPGTTYYYRVEASNGLGSATGSVKSFRTTGTPPPSATTGAPENLSASSATLTGVVYPQGQPTTYYFRYGLSPSYGLQTAAAVVPAGTAPVTVATTVPGLQAGTTFHYQLVAMHGSSGLSGGADGSFETFPSPAPKPQVQASTSPRRIRRGPYTFRIEGRIVNPSPATPPPLACVGTVVVSIGQGHRTLAEVAAPIQPDCTYAGTVSLTRLPAHRKGTSLKLGAYAHFGGNDYLAAAGAERTTVTVG